MSRRRGCDIDIVEIAFTVAVIAILIDKGAIFRVIVIKVIDLTFQMVVIGIIDLMAVGLTVLAVALGRPVLAPRLAGWKARRRARRREAHLEALRGTFRGQGSGARRREAHLEVLRGTFSGQDSDFPRPFDPQAAAIFLEVLEFGDPHAALRAAGVREGDVRAWLAAGLNWATEDDPRREFAVQVLEIIRRWLSRRGSTIAGEPDAPRLSIVGHPEHRRGEIVMRPSTGVEHPE